jgi:hypothetical protein
LCFLFVLPVCLTAFLDTLTYYGTVSV